MAAAYPSHVVAYDFLQDQDMHGRTFYILTVMDEFTREGLAIEVADATSAAWVFAVLSELVALYGAPAYLRSDNGAEFVALAVQAWLAQRQIRTRSIDPGCPWQNGKEERFNGTVRDECLNLHFFASLAEARVRLERFRNHYNTDRPHSRLDYKTPAAFKQAWEEAQARICRSARAGPRRNEEWVSQGTPSSATWPVSRASSSRIRGPTSPRTGVEKKWPLSRRKP